MARLDKLRARLKQEGLEAMVVTQPENRRYLSGFAGTAGALLISEKEAIIFVDFRYIGQAKVQAPDFRLIREDRTEPLEKEFAQALQSALSELKVRRLGFEAHHLSVVQHQVWLEILQGTELVPTQGFVEDLRAVKESEEIDVIRQAVALTDETYLWVRDRVRPGVTERELAWEAEAHMRTHGAEGLAFEMIVQAGANAAMSHWRAADNPIKEGEPLLLDMGAKIDGYHADLTRTLFLGRGDAQFEKIYNIVLEAQKKALQGIRPGMKGMEADALGRQVIEEAGYGEYFGHGLGHGVGLAIHEVPWARRTSDNVLRPGMLLTVEPGIYLPGWGGVRIEDLVLITDNGAQVLSQAPKNPWRG